MLTSFVAFAGVLPRRMPPSTLIPFATSAALSAPVANVGGSSTTYSNRRGGELEPMRPDTRIVPSPCRRTERLAPPPETVFTLLTSGIAVVAGSNFTPSGVTVTQTRFSFSDNPETRAAYPACRYRESHPCGIFSSSNADASPMTSPVTCFTPRDTIWSARKFIGAPGPPCR